MEDSMIDSRFIYAKEPVLKVDTIMGFETEVVKPKTQSSTQYTFNFPRDKLTSIRFGPFTGFEVKGVFECKENTPDSVFELIPEDDFKKVQLIPNWFEHCIKSVDVMHGYQIIRSYEVPRNGDIFLNTYLYSNLDSQLKHNAFPQKVHPVYSVPTRLDGWTLEDNSEWHAYSKELFGKSSIAFQFIPSFVFPFYQLIDYKQGNKDKNEPIILPPEIFCKTSVVLHFMENFDHIFKKSENNTKEYRFRIRSIDLQLEMAYLRKDYEVSLLKKLKQKGMLYFPGVTKIAKILNIPSGLLYYKFGFDNVLMPEGIFIFALPKSVESRNFRFQESYSARNPIFSKHNIDRFEIRFGNLEMAQRSPNFGDIRDKMTVIRTFIDHIVRPPFGLAQDSKLRVYQNFENGGENGLFPHVYINLCLSHETQVLDRKIPVTNDGSLIDKPNYLDVRLMFNEKGAAPDVTYYAYIFYTDICMQLDLSSGQYMPYYGHRQMLF